MGGVTGAVIGVSNIERSLLFYQWLLNVNNVVYDTHITEHDGYSDHDDHQGVLDEVGFKPYTHVEIAKDARADLLDDNKLTIAGHDYTVHP